MRARRRARARGRQSGPLYVAFLGFVASFRSVKMVAKCSREETYSVPEALTSCERLIPPALA
jgi:hypothetical protein